MALPKFEPNYQYEDYLSWSGDWELYGGIPVSMSPSPGRRHQRRCRQIVLALSELLDLAKCEDCELFFEIDWKITPNTVVRPDIVVVCEDETSRIIEHTPVLVVEILSDSTRDRDLGYKRELYQHLGVKYYVWSDPETSEVQILVNKGSCFEEMCPADQPLQLHLGCQVHWPDKLLA